MATTCKLIAKSVLGSAAANIEFTSIPGTYTDLYLITSLRSAKTGATWDGSRIRINGVTTSSYSYRSLSGNGSSASSLSGSTTSIFYGYVTAASATSSTFASGEIYIPNYAGATNKSLSTTQTHETNATTAYIEALASLFSNTSAISSILLYADAGNLVAGSSAYLYGITKA
jgi:hypothetical protein